MTIEHSSDLTLLVETSVARTPVFDIHTHLCPPAFGDLFLWGVDELLTYHYLVAELFRFCAITPEQFWALGKTAQADLVWETLFVKSTPLSEAATGVCTALAALGLDPRARDLREARSFFAARDPLEYVDLVLQKANVCGVSMTNDPFDERERRVWASGGHGHSRFHAVLRLDAIVNSLTDFTERLREQGYDVRAEADARSIDELRRFLDDWIERISPLYLAVSLPPTFDYPEDSQRALVLTGAVLPTCRAHAIPFAMMTGVTRRVNARLREAGDGLGLADVGALERLCADHPENRFLVTMLARENQHALCVAARKFSNLMPFGCWWFMNNPSIIEEITRERIELLGTSFIPQHSDARILDQLLYKWPHSRRVIGTVLAESYQGLARAGRTPTREEIDRDVARLFSGNFLEFVKRAA